MLGSFLKYASNSMFSYICYITKKSHTVAATRLIAIFIAKMGSRTFAVSIWAPISVKITDAICAEVAK